MTAATAECSTAKKAFSLGIAAYVLAWAGVFVFVCRVFGIGLAILLSLIFAYPFVVAVRMRRRWSAVRGREFAFLLVLVIIAVGGSGYVVWDWYDNGMHDEHAEDIRFEELARIVHAYPAFRNIEFSITRFKGRYVIRGTVASQSDLERLKSLCDQHGFSAYAEDVVVSGSANRTSE